MHQFAPVKEHFGEGDGREGKRNTKWPLLRGRLQGGGDPRVAYRGQAGERMWKQDGGREINLEGRGINL